MSKAAEAALADVTALPKTDSRTELDQRRVKTRDDISRLVRASKRHLLMRLPVRQSRVPHHKRTR
ncbi:hypothetical protein ABT116_25925 [Streptomyces sp. NPDC002130]|uniref:hypothetical protein n=1 Tax=Streptomyces sp. NPDC002130 TaxID=3155568 RepID=UPI0033322ABA